MRPTLTVDVIVTWHGLEALAAEWNTLLRKTSANTVFLTWEWISTWWSVYGGNGQLHVLAARTRKGELVGIAPLRRARRSILGFWRWDVVTFIGSGEDVTPEYLDLIVDPAWESEVVAAFVENLASDPEIKVIDLCPFASSSRHLDQLTRLLSARDGGTRRSFYSTCPVFDLPASREAFMQHRSRNYRKKLTEYERRCDRKLQAQLRCSSSEAELQRDMASLVKLHHMRWNGRTRAFRSKRYLEFHHRLAPLMLERGWMRMFVLEAASKPIAALYCFNYDGRYSFYQSGRDPDHERDHVGLVIMHKAILAAIEERATVFDFLRGKEEYKYRWARADQHSERLLYWSSFTARSAGLFMSAQRRLFLTPKPK